MLYVLLFVIPLSGWLYSSATGVQVLYLGVVPLPDLVGKDSALGDALRIVHVSLNACLFAVVVRACRRRDQASFHRSRCRARPDAADRQTPGNRAFMSRSRILPWALGALTFLAAGIALADSVVVDKSEIGFTIEADGRQVRRPLPEMEGRRRLPAERARDIPRPTSTSISAASISPAANRKPKRRAPLWFDTAKFPVAHFTSTSIRISAATAYEVAGKLTLKGITRDCVVPLTLRTDAAGNRVAEGTFSLKRLDYRIGEGEWADTETVDNDILVHVRMVLARPVHMTTRGMPHRERRLLARMRAGWRSHETTR